MQEKVGLAGWVGLGRALKGGAPMGGPLRVLPRSGALVRPNPCAFLPFCPPIFQCHARTCREAGARVKFNAYLRDMNVNVRSADERRIEVLALPYFNEVQFAIDTTQGMSKDGQPHPQAADVDGIVLDNARRDKEAKYPELVASGRCRLVEAGGAMKQLTSCGSLPKHALEKCLPPCLTLQPLHGKGGGPGC